MNIFGTNTTTASQPAETFVPLNLSKDELLDLTKEAPLLKHCIIGCGWDINAAGKDNFDLDISAFMLGKNGRVRDIHKRVVYFRALAQEGIYLEEDNRTGAGEGDDERIHVDLDAVPVDVEEILFNVNIFGAQEKRQTFGMVANSYIRILDEDDNEREIARYNLKDEASSSTAVVFASLKRRPSGGWDFKTIGEGIVVKDLNGLLMRYYG